jgi:NAD(P)-dependent dehydrogenase (short-subunit alcohol dehydrogenase family)
VTEVAGKTAVITGAASGIGYGLACQALARGMQVVMSDIDEADLQRALREATDRFGDHAAAVVADVTGAADVARLKEEAEERFGPTFLLVNNAGVTVGSQRAWEVPIEDWRWLLDVNLWGVIHGLSVFVPDMVARDSGYVVNTASMAGLLAPDSMAPYVATKHAIVGISESLFRDLEVAGSNVGVSVLCAGPVETRLFDAARNRQPRYGSAPAESVLSTLEPPDRMGAEEAGKIVFDAIAEDQFWILTHPGLYADAIRGRGNGAASQANPDELSADPWVMSLDHPATD